LVSEALFRIFRGLTPEGANFQIFHFRPNWGVRAVSDTDNFSKSAISAKPAHPDTDQTLSNYSNTEHSHIRLVIIIALAVLYPSGHHHRAGRIFQRNGGDGRCPFLAFA
jgi:hypothetical protein